MGDLDTLVDLVTATVWAQDVSLIHEEATTNHGGIALVADKAVTMPVTLLKRDELSATKTSNRLGAAAALFGKLFAVAVSAVWFLVFGRKLFLGQLLVACGAREALTMPWHVLIGHTSLVDHAIALGTFLSELALVARNADDLLIPGDKALVPDWLRAHHACEALLMPLLSLVLKLLHSSLEWFGAAITAGCKVVVMTVSAVDLVILRGKWFIHQCLLTLNTLEAELVPVMVFVGQVLVIWTNGLLAFLTIVSEKFLVAGNTVRVFLLQNVATRNQLLVAVLACKMVFVVTDVHCFGVLGRKYQLITGGTPRPDEFCIVSFAVQFL